MTAGQSRRQHLDGTADPIEPHSGGNPFSFLTLATDVKTMACPVNTRARSFF